MGMAASQARFLQLTARKTNLEYMGQQINQERLALANQSAGLFERMLTMEPPVPPSSLDDKYYSPGYSFEDPSDEIKKKVSWTTIAAAVDAGDISAGTELISIDYDDGSTSGTESLTFSEWTEATLDALVDGEGTDVNSGVNIDDELLALMTNFGFAPQSQAETVVLRYVSIEHDIYNPDGSSSTVVRNAPAILEFDNSGRLLHMTMLDQIYSTSDLSGGGGVTAYGDIAGVDMDAETGYGANNSNNIIGNNQELTYSPVFDEDAFNDAMNKYEYEKATYDYEIERINLETARIQKQDRSLELKLKQIDTEHTAIQTEMDAVQKVMQKNIESSFKTFS